MQNIVARSSVGAKYSVVLCYDSHEICNFMDKNLLIELGIEVKKPMVMFCNNQAAIIF